MSRFTTQAHGVASAGKLCGHAITSARSVLRLENIGGLSSSITSTTWMNTRSGDLKNLSEILRRESESETCFQSAEIVTKQFAIRKECEKPKNKNRR